MKDKMLVHLLIVISIIKRQANAQTTLAPSDQKTTMQLEHEITERPIVSPYIAIVRPITERPIVSPYIAIRRPITERPIVSPYIAIRRPITERPIVSPYIAIRRPITERPIVSPYIAIRRPITERPIVSPYIAIRRPITERPIVSPYIAIIRPITERPIVSPYIAIRRPITERPIVSPYIAIRRPITERPIVSPYIAIIRPTTDATSAGLPTQTTSGSTTAAKGTDIPNFEAQTDEMATSTIAATYAVLKMIGFTKQSTSSSTSHVATVNASSEIPIIAAQNAETESPTVVTTQAASSSSPIMSTTSPFESTVQTSSGQTQTELSVFTDSTSTRLSPAAKLSVTTEIAVDSETTKLGKTTDSEMQTSAMKTSMPMEPTTTPMEPTTKTETETTYIETPKNGVNHGRIIAWIIGGALIAMLIGFLVIWYKKRKLKKHQIATTDWAGPTPFLESGEVNNGSLRGASRISLTSFLPQRLSKRLSLLAEEMPDTYELTTSSTFGGKEEKKVEKNGVQVDKVEKKDAKVDGNLSNSNEAVEKKSESSNKTEVVVLVDELKPNGEVKSKDIIGPEKIPNGEKEDGKIQPLSAENSPKEEKVN